jgi:outer membrane protein assembly factor BamB
MDELLELLDGDWSSTRAAAATKRALYVIDDDTALYRIDPRTGRYEDSIEDGWQSRHMVALDDALYIFEPSGVIYRVDPDAATYDSIASGWHDVRAVAACGDRLFAIDGRELYAIDPVSGACEERENTWDPRHLVGHRDHLFEWDADNNLYRIDPKTGLATVLENTWPLVSGVATAVGRLYAVDDGILYEIDPATGETAVVTDRLHTRMLVGGGSTLFSFEDHGSLYRIGVG